MQLTLPGLDSLDHESVEAQEVKTKPILVIVGNPPYRARSRNHGEFITNLIKDYRTVNGEPLGEKNPRWLQDDYVKFIRFAQHKMDKVNEGIVGIITNHSFLDNATFRGMRSSLLKSFNQIYIINLHGNSTNLEANDNKSKDENVFDIKKGVCISFFIKKEGLKREVYYEDWRGKKEEKFIKCYSNSISRLKKIKLSPEMPEYLFVPYNRSIKKEYEKHYSLKNIFAIHGVGITTAHDDFVISKYRKELLDKFIEFQGSPRDSNYLHKKFHVREKKGWNICEGWDSFRELNKDQINYLIKNIAYRPFDVRKIIYHPGVVWRTVDRVMQHMLAAENIGLACARINKSNTMDHFFCTESITEFKATESTTGSCLFPLYLYHSQLDEQFPLPNNFEAKTENFTPAFRQWIDEIYQHSFTPEQIIGYIYSILFSPTYRSEFCEFLKMDFPRIPFIGNKEIFKKFSALGWELIQVHLMKNVPSLNMGEYMGQGSHNVDKLSYVASEGKIYINSSKYFSNIPKEVWEFSIGGYQVLNKYLKARKRCELTYEEIKHIENVANILAFTIQQMKKIDEIYTKIDQKDWH